MSGDAETAETSNSVAPAAAQSGGGNYSSQHVVISMAPQPFRAVNKDMFTPLSVPIGPYHHARCSSRWAQEKQRVAKEIVNSREDALRRELRKLEGDVRACYGSLPKMKPDKFVDMLLNDGCYVLQFFVQYPGLPDVNPPRGEQSTVTRDIMYLLENQLPMIVLDRIHRFLLNENENAVVLDAVQVRVRKLLKEDLYIRGVNKPTNGQAAPSHLLQLVHTYFQPQLGHISVSIDSGEQSESSQQRSHISVSIDSGEQSESSQQRSATRNNDQNEAEDAGDRRRRMGRWRRATEYSMYGNVQLKPRNFELGVESILDVRLEGSTLLIPRLQIDGSTWTILRNLMALEEQTGTRPVVTAYCLFMSQLASKVEDIELLMQREIIEHSWGNEEEVAQGFADLCKKVVLDVDDPHSNYLCRTWHLLHERCESLGHNFWGSFRHRYCGDSVRILAFVTAGLVFAFQLIQVILAGFSLPQRGK